MLIPHGYAGKRVFITGHTGFKGSWLALWLHELGAEITGFSLPPDSPDAHFVGLDLGSKVRHIEGDIRNAGTLKAGMQEARPEVVFHLAAQPLVRRSYLEPKLTFDTNVGGSVNLLEAVRHTESVRALVYVTSDKCYRDQPGPGGYAESDVLGGKDPYSASKACAELLFTCYMTSFFQYRRGFAAASARAGNVIGGGDWAQDRIVPDCIRALRAGVPIPVRNPAAIRPWQHVLDALYGYLLLGAQLASDQGADFSGAWNFGPDQDSHRTVQQVVQEVVRIWGSGSYRLAAGGAHLAESAVLCLNSAKSRDRLGWRPVWHFEDAIEQTVSWYAAYVRGDDVWDLSRQSLEQYALH